MGKTDSEFACEVVRVTRVEAHPNADRLDIVRFAMCPEHTETAYTCVSQRGAFALGSLAVYCSVDAIVPLDRPEFAFLKKPETARPTHRLKAARLRGVYSEGLLVPAPAGARFGDDMATPWGVGYHDPKPQGGALTGPTPPSASPKRDWRRTALPEFDVLSLRKAPGLFAEGENVVVTEKVHGTNFRFGALRSPGIFGGRHFVVGSHRVYKTDNRGWLARLLRRGKVRAHWYGEDLWCAAAKLHDLEERCHKLAPRIGFYAELFGVTETGKAIQDLAYGAPTLGVRVFDARDQKTGQWLPWHEVIDYACEVGLGIAPVIYLGAYPGLDVVRSLAEGSSPTAVLHGATLDQIREGVVVRSYDGAKRGKWVGEGYRMRKEQP